MAISLAHTAISYIQNGEELSADVAGVLNRPIAQLIENDLSLVTTLNSELTVLNNIISEIELGQGDVNSATITNLQNQISNIYALMAQYYTKAELQLPGQSSVNWGNITNQPTHNQISGIQGGTPTERYHLDSASYQRVLNAGTPNGFALIGIDGSLSTSALPDHNTVNGLQGGGSGDFYHIDSTTFARVQTNAGSANGVALLDGSGIVPVGNLPAHDTLPLVQGSAGTKYHLSLEAFDRAQTNAGSANGFLVLGPDGLVPISLINPVAHNNTLGLQGGATDEYYHLSEDQLLLVSLAGTPGGLAVLGGDGFLPASYFDSIATISDIDTITSIEQILNVHQLEVANIGIYEESAPPYGAALPLITRVSGSPKIDTSFLRFDSPYSLAELARFPVNYIGDIPDGMLLLTGSSQSLLVASYPQLVGLLPDDGTNIIIPAQPDSYYKWYIRVE